MTGFLELSGLNVPVKLESGSFVFDEIGARTRSASGQTRDTRRGIRRTWKGDACFWDNVAATAFQNLLLGNGHRFSFENGLDAFTGLHVRDYDDLQLFFSGGSTRLRITTGGFIRIPAKLYEQWTIAYNFPNDIVMQRDDGKIYVDGTLNNTYFSGHPAQPAVVLPAGDLEIVAAATVNLFDLAIFPFRFSEEQMQQITDNGGPFSDFPVLNMTGAMIGDSIARVTGSAPSSPYVEPAGPDGKRNMIQVSFELTEYDETHRSPA